MVNLPEKRKYLIYSFFLSITSFNFVRFLNTNLNSGNEFQIAGWLINYNYGFTRRGLFGSLIINFFENSTSLNLFLSLLLTTIYFYIAVGIVKIFFDYEQNIISILILFSPAFYLYNFWDFTGSYRKEILGIATLIYLIRNLNTKYQLKVTIFTIVLLNFSIYSSEVNLFFIFSIWFILKSNFHEISLKLKNLLIACTVGGFSLIYFYNSLIFNSNITIGSKICSQLKTLGYSDKICDGSLYYLDLNTADTFNRTFNYVTNQTYDYKMYIFLFFYFLIPFLMDKSFIFESKFTILNIINFLPLFLIANDWGRWFYIFFIVVGLNYFCNSNKAKYFQINRTTFILSIIYLTSFRLNHCCIETTNPSYLNWIPFNHIYQYLDRLF